VGRFDQPVKVVVLRNFPGILRNPEPRSSLAPDDLTPLIDIDGRLQPLGGVKANAKMLREVVQESLGEPLF
jgi:hypothetical protein